MRILDDRSKLPPGQVCVAIGVFDGVHLGHQQVIRQTISDAQHLGAQACVITFDRHPKTVVAPDRAPPLIYSLPQKLRAIAALGAHAVLLIRFDEAFSRLSGEEFIRQLTRDFDVIQSICVGGNFTFGYHRSGNVLLLKKLAAELGFRVHGLAAVALNGQPVSSTRIRQAIRTGELDAASQMLGRPYSLAGHVIHGDKLGTQLGFPTANLDVRGLVLPPHGVYAIRTRFRNQSLLGVLNIGFRPTLHQPEPSLRAEVHLLHFHQNLYAQELELDFVRKLRDEKTFASLAELKEQIACDVAEAEQLLRR